MEDQIGTAVEGRIKIFKNSELIVDEKNQISNEAVVILLSGMKPNDATMGITTIMATGDFGSVNSPIPVYVREDYSSVSFTVDFNEASFNGNLENIRLVGGAIRFTDQTFVSYEFANKYGLNIDKDGASTITVKWIIKIKRSNN